MMMRIKKYRYFGGMLAAQEKWLGHMAQKGYRLAATGTAVYEFEPCKPGQVQYKVEFIGHMPQQRAQDYCSFLQDMGYRVFYKSMNLNWSAGRLRWRPWADKGGKLASDSGTFGRELLIVEKANDGRPFELHTSLEDKALYFRNLCRPWVFLFLMFAVFGLLCRSYLFGLFALLSLGPAVFYRVQAIKFKKQAKTEEW